MRVKVSRNVPKFQKLTGTHTTPHRFAVVRLTVNGGPATLRMFHVGPVTVTVFPKGKK